MRGQKAFIISSKYPFPMDDGKKAVLIGFVSYLINRLGPENVCYVVIGRRPAVMQTELPCTTRWIAPPGRLRQIWNVLVDCIVCKRRSLQEALTFSPQVADQLRSLMVQSSPDIVILDTIRVGQLLPSPLRGVGRRVLYMDDLFYLRFQSILRASPGRSGNRVEALGTFARHLPAFARAVIRVGVVQRALLRMEASAVERRELESPAHFDACWLINPREAEELRSRTSAANVFSIKPIPYDQPCCVARVFDGRPVFVIFGTLLNPAHRFSVCFFLEHCMQDVVSTIPDVRVLIVGAGADERLRGLAARFTHAVELCGFVERVEDVMSAACALLVPLLFGGGLRLKMVTALYHGLPVISTDHGISGLDLRDGEGVVQENDLRKFPVHMKRLLDLKANRALSTSAAKAFAQHYSREVIYAEYDALFGLGETR